ncbi:hypothetical protein AVEN_191203-1 [Araneus ventricosus]|uniref:Uncharacterized protein n=1 Tax=Araneus ventricosus TaxID=182803 RepID=A0A4Y2JG37_ARAVE|nr:hypothetical protein AVEN_191203-1 [Araneus ventricosus]
MRGVHRRQLFCAAQIIVKEVPGLIHLDRFHCNCVAGYALSFFTQAHHPSDPLKHSDKIWTGTMDFNNPFHFGSSRRFRAIDYLPGWQGGRRRDPHP